MTNTMVDNLEPQSSVETETEDSSGMSVSRMVMLATGVVIAIILALLIFGLVASLTAAETWAPVMQIFRDVFMVIFIVEGILVIGAIAILVIQVARFFVMLQTEVKPILDNARETTKTTKATAQFVSQNATDPLIQIKSFFAGLAIFIRELLKIRGLVNPNKSGANDGKSESS